MAKTVTISMAEYEYMQTVIAHDGMIIAKLESEIARLKKELGHEQVQSQEDRSRRPDL